MSDLPEICPPCPVDPGPPSILPTVRVQTVVVSCLKDALEAMAKQFYCDLENGPKGCR